jgi:DnaJ-class molecular chaperone
MIYYFVTKKSIYIKNCILFFCKQKQKNTRKKMSGKETKKEPQKMQDIETLYQVLRVSADCDTTMFDKMRRRCLFAVHPDRSKIKNKDKLEASRLLIEFAYEILKDVTLRRKYDVLMRLDYHSNKLTVVGTKKDNLETLKSRIEEQNTVHVNAACVISASHSAAQEFKKKQEQEYKKVRRDNAKMIYLFKMDSRLYC